jgi:hypothetical protein
MGPSSDEDEIDRRIREADRELDEGLELSERQAASSRYWRLAAVAGAGLAAVVIVTIVYRRRRKRVLVEHLRDVLFESVRDLPDEVTSRLDEVGTRLDEVGSRLKEQLPAEVVVAARRHQQSAADALTGIARKAAPAVVGSAVGALLSRLVRASRPDTAAAD